MPEIKTIVDFSEASTASFLTQMESNNNLTLSQSRSLIRGIDAYRFILENENLYNRNEKMLILIGIRLSKRLFGNLKTFSQNPVAMKKYQFLKPIGRCYFTELFLIQQKISL